MRNPVSDEDWQSTLKALELSDWNIREASRLSGIPRTTIQNRLKAKGISRSSVDGVPDGFKERGRSTLIDAATGEEKLVWIKTTADAQRQEQMVRETIAALVEDIKPAKPVKLVMNTLDDLSVGYAIGDVHLGLYSWGAETGSSVDTTVVSQDLMAAADRLVASAPAASECIIAQLGDFFHMDSGKNVTPASGNQLDVDTRFAKVVRVGVSTLRYVIDRALEKHRTVRIRNVAGNHDPHSHIILTEALRGYYYDEPRVVIEDTPRPMFIYRFGLCLVGITHGHQAKPEKLPGLLAVDAPRDWGACEFKYVWHGHIHHKRIIEEMGVPVESFRTLTGNDAWHTEQGYRSGREMQAIVLHKDYGEIERHTAGLKRVRSVADVRRAA